MAKDKQTISCRVHERVSNQTSKVRDISQSRRYDTIPNPVHRAPFTLGGKFKTPLELHF